MNEITSMARNAEVLPVSQASQISKLSQTCMQMCQILAKNDIKAFHTSFSVEHWERGGCLI